MAVSIPRGGVKAAQDHRLRLRYFMAGKLMCWIKNDHHQKAQYHRNHRCGDQ
jgi:hypothetical protein